jgi:hypothetical protein
MRVTTPSRQRGAPALPLAVAALGLLGAGVLWLALRALVALLTLD